MARVSPGRAPAGGLDLRRVERFAVGPHHATVYKTLAIEALSGTEKGIGENRRLPVWPHETRSWLKKLHISYQLNLTTVTECNCS